jgi:hypothetical protein
MKFLYRKYPAKKKEVIEVHLDRPAKVKFMTAGEFRKYAGGRTHAYFNGLDSDGRVRFTLPFDSVWHVVVEKGGDPLLMDLRANTVLRMPDPVPEQLTNGTLGSEEPGPATDAEVQQTDVDSGDEGE